MQKQIIQQPEIKMAGIKIRTSNSNEFNAATAKLGAHVNRYHSENLAAFIPNRKNPGATLVAYTNYESDENGEYDYIIGEAVSSFDDIPEELTCITIPADKYLKLTTDAGKIPQVVIQAWQQIWEMTQKNALGGNRKYKVDFEVYDQRAMDPQNAIMDIYLGIK